MSSGESTSFTATPQATSTTAETDDEGYHPDHAIDSDNDQDYESSSDDDGGLTMMRRKSAVQGPGRSMSITNAQLARYRERRDTAGSRISKKSSRSGSNNTMKKVRSRGDSEPEDLRGRPINPAALP